jgi:hypothetical protein
VNEWIIAFGVGGVLFVAGLAFMVSHRRTWRQQQADDTLDEADLKHYRKRYRRRMQTSALIVLLGILIPVGDVVIPWKDLPKVEAALWWAAYWGTVLMITLWVLLLGMGDLFSTKSYAQSTLARNYQQQRILEEQIAQIKRRETNGHGPGVE